MRSFRENGSRSKFAVDDCEAVYDTIFFLFLTKQSVRIQNAKVRDASNLFYNFTAFRLAHPTGNFYVSRSQFPDITARNNCSRRRRLQTRPAAVVTVLAAWPASKFRGLRLNRATAPTPTHPLCRGIVLALRRPHISVLFGRLLYTVCLRGLKPNFQRSSLCLNPPPFGVYAFFLLLSCLFFIFRNLL